MPARRRDFALVLGLAFVLAGTASATPPNLPELHTREPLMLLPFVPMTGSRVRDVELYVSTDNGRNWVYVTQAVPSTRREENKFRYTAPSDGSYWFSVRSIDQNNTAMPPTLDRLQPGIVVHLDRKPPIIQLRAATSKGPNVVGVEWDVRDEHFDPSRFTLEYRVPGQSEWLVQPADGKVSGTQYWELTTAPKIEVRLKVADRAGNDAEGTIALLPGGGSSGGGTSLGTNPEPAASTAANNVNPPQTPSRPSVRFLNSLQIAIPFRISNVGVSGVPVLDLWYTRDQGRSWQKVPRATDEGGTLPAVPGDGEAISKQFAFAAPTEGLYGFTVVVRSGVGIGDVDPRTGDVPKLSVEVDVTKPEVEMRAVAGAATDVRNVTIEWSTRDKNLAERPVSLLYATSKEGPWETIIADLDARGRYVWSVSDQGPFQFYVQVRSVDKAGNVGSATGPERITVDLNRPRADFLDPAPLDRKR